MKRRKRPRVQFEPPSRLYLRLVLYSVFLIFVLLGMGLFSRHMAQCVAFLTGPQQERGDIDIPVHPADNGEGNG